MSNPDPCRVMQGKGNIMTDKHIDNMIAIELLRVALKIAEDIKTEDYEIKYAILVAAIKELTK